MKPHKNIYSQDWEVDPGRYYVFCFTWVGFLWFSVVLAVLACSGIGLGGFLVVVWVVLGMVVLRVFLELM